MNLFRFIPGYETRIYDAGKEPILFLFLAFMIAFALTRLYTRLARVHGWGSGNVGGVHVHHIIPGIVLMAGAGISAFAPWGDGPIARDILAIFFGIGTALVLDEFALVFHLEDVYWTQEGQSSIVAFCMGAALAGLCLLAAAPFGVGANNESGALDGVFTEIALNVVFALRHVSEREAVSRNSRDHRPDRRLGLGVPAREAGIAVGPLVLRPRAR